jgi:hypothetical protein
LNPFWQYRIKFLVVGTAAHIWATPLETNPVTDVPVTV